MFGPRAPPHGLARLAIPVAFDGHPTARAFGSPGTSKYTFTAIWALQSTVQLVDRKLRTARPRKFGIVLAWSVDRLGRSLQDLVGFLAEFHVLKIDLCLKQQGIDTTTPAGKALFGMMGVFAEFERSMIQERVRAGLERARRDGKRLGRPPLGP